MEQTPIKNIVTTKLFLVMRNSKWLINYYKRILKEKSVNKTNKKPRQKINNVIQQKTNIKHDS